MVLLRSLLGDALRHRRQDQGRTLREVSSRARVSLGYLSEVERGQKEASSELLSAICGALDLPMSRVLREVSDRLAASEQAGASPAGRVGAASIAGHLVPEDGSTRSLGRLPVPVGGLEQAVPEVALIGVAAASGPSGDPIDVGVAA